MGSFTVTTGYEYGPNNIYSVAINNLATLTGTGSNSGGTIDNTSQPYYTVFSSTLSLALDKERGNIRWEQIMLNLNQYMNVWNLYDIVAVGANQDTPASSFTFNVQFDRQDYVEDPNQPTFTDIQSITRAISTALTQAYTERRIYYDPTLVLTPSGYGVRGPTDAEVTADVLGGGSISTVEANMVVTQIA